MKFWYFHFHWLITKMKENPFFIILILTSTKVMVVIVKWANFDWYCSFQGVKIFQVCLLKWSFKNMGTWISFNSSVHFFFWIETGFKCWRKCQPIKDAHLVVIQVNKQYYFLEIFDQVLDSPYKMLVRVTIDAVHRDLFTTNIFDNLRWFAWLIESRFLLTNLFISWYY